MAKKILVLGEIRDGSLRNVSYEAISAAKLLADGGEIVALLIGADAQSVAQNMIQYGANRVITVSDASLEQYTTSGYAQAVLQIMQQENADGLVIGHTAVGKDLAPKIASKLESGLVSDVTAIEADAVFVRPIYAGKASEEKAVETDKFVVTIRPNNIKAAEPDASLSGEVTAASVEVKDLQTIVKEVVRKASEGVDLSEAAIVVSGGRGVKSSEGIDLMKQLADLLGGAVGASRGACDAGYCDYSFQIGQTGKVVTPDLYIACGISGAIQHLAGMSNSKVIVAINKDPEANIFNVADYGIVGDLFEVVPMLIEEIKKAGLAV